MKKLSGEKIYRELKEGLLQAGVRLPDDVKKALEEAKKKETGPALAVLEAIDRNIDAAEKGNIPLCQDTGMVLAFVEKGDDLTIEGDFIDTIIERAVEDAYREGYFRKSVVLDPLKDRKNSENNLPPVIYHRITEGSDLKINLLLKGFGSENCSRTVMMKPTSSREDVIQLVCGLVRSGGASPCPPVVLGIGLGGTMDYAARLSKEALLRHIDDKHCDPWYADLERDLLERINALGIGSGGLGGMTTALAVKILTYPTHIAGLPLALSVNCWADRKVLIEMEGK